MLLEDAYRLLDNLQVVASLSKFKECEKYYHFQILNE